MQRYIILKSIKNAKNDKDLDKYLQRAKVHIVEYVAYRLSMIIIPYDCNNLGERPLRSHHF